MKESLADIAYAIDQHTKTEHANMPCQGGVARYYVDLEEMPDIHQVFLANVKVRKQVWYGDDSINIWKNSKLGGALIMKGIGKSIYYGNRPEPYNMKVYNMANYRHWISGSIDQVEIQQEDKKRYRFAKKDNKKRLRKKKHCVFKKSVKKMKEDLVNARKRLNVLRKKLQKPMLR